MNRSRKLSERHETLKSRGAKEKGGTRRLFSVLLQRYTRNDSPQPHSSFTLGLLNLKPSFSPSRAKSSSVPSRNRRLFGSTTTLTPWLSKVWSSVLTASAYSIR